jgi:hypothetical protein
MAGVGLWPVDFGNQQFGIGASRNYEAGDYLAVVLP